MRKVALTVIAALVAGAALAGSAEAINSEQKFSASVAPTTAGTVAKPTPVSLSVRQWFDDISLDPDTFAVKEVRFFFPKEIVFNTRRFPYCSRAKVSGGAGRCRGARIGSGKGVGTALGLTEDLRLEIYNGPGGNRIEIRVIGTTPLEIDGVIEGKLTRQTADPRYGQVLTVTIPAAFTRKIFDTYATLMDLSAKVPVRTIKVGKRKLPFAALTGCAQGSLTFGYSADYTDGTTRTVEVVQPCGGTPAQPPATP
jgi:hypothetical protein